MATNNKRGALDESVREQAAAFVRVHGVRHAAELLGIGERGLTSALAGLSLTPATRAAITHGLAAFAAQQRPSAPPAEVAR